MKEIMTRRELNRLSGIAPVGLSLLAFGLVLIVATTGWERHLPDEGTAAHLFQLTIGAEIPLILLSLGTADWKRARSVVLPLSCQLAGLLLAFGAVAWFRL
jgi:hypothetical protein